MLVAEATRGNDPDLAIAAVFHDSIEDQEVPRVAETRVRQLGAARKKRAIWRITVP